MYSSEIEALLQAQHYMLSLDDCNRVMDVNTNTQITNMKYFCAENEYHVLTNDGYHFIFKVQNKE